MPLGPVSVQFSASADKYAADLVSMQTRSTVFASQMTSTTGAISAAWGKTGTAATDAVRKMEQASAQQGAARSLQDTTSGIVKGWGKTGDAAVEAGRVTEHSITAAHGSAHLLEEMLGIHLPRAVNTFLADSKSIGPLLAGAFSGLAVIGLLQALEQLPGVYAKLEGAVTGWDEKSRKAYDHFLEDNKKAVDAAEEFRLKLTEIGSGKVASIKEAIADQTEENKRNLGVVAGINQKLIDQQQIIEDLAKLGQTGGVAFLSAEDEATRAKFQGIALEGANKLQALQNKLVTETLTTQLDKAEELATKRQKAGEEEARTAEERMKAARDYAAFWSGALEDFKNRTFEGGEVVKAGLAESERLAKAIIKDWEDLLKLEQTAGDDFIKNQEFWGKQLEDFRNRSVGGGESVAEGLKASDITAKNVIDHFKEVNRKSEEFVKSFREGAGHVWDDFLSKGTGILSSLANLAKGLLSTLGRTLFQDFATSLFGGFASKLGLLIGSKTHMPGGVSGGDGGGAGGLLGSLGGLFSKGGGGGGGWNAATGGFTQSTGGIGGMLGLGGGSGLFGLGAATIPVIGAAVASGFALYSALHHPKVPAPQLGADPFEKDKTRTFGFNTTFPFEKLNQVLEKLDKTNSQLNGTLQNVSTQDPGVLMIDNFPAIKEHVQDAVVDGVTSDRAYRRDLSGAILDLAL